MQLSQLFTSHSFLAFSFSNEQTICPHPPRCPSWLCPVWVQQGWESTGMAPEAVWFRGIPTSQSQRLPDFTIFLPSLLKFGVDLWELQNGAIESNEDGELNQGGHTPGAPLGDQKPTATAMWRMPRLPPPKRVHTTVIIESQEHPILGFLPRFRADFCLVQIGGKQRCNERSIRPSWSFLYFLWTWSTFGLISCMIAPDPDHFQPPWLQIKGFPESPTTKLSPLGKLKDHHIDHSLFGLRLFEGNSSWSGRFLCVFNHLFKHPCSKSWLPAKSRLIQGISKHLRIGPQGNTPSLLNSVAAPTLMRRV